VVKRLLGMGKKVVLIYETPEIGWNVPIKIKQNQVQGIKDDLTVSYERVKKRNRDITLNFDKIKHVNITRIYPEEVLCSTKTNRCRTQNGSTIYYNDNHHFNYDIAVSLFSDEIRKALKF
jgi:hypothetical protein